MLRIGIKSDMGRAIDRLSRMPNDISGGLVSGVRGEAIRLQEHIVRDYLSGQALHPRSGRLWRSIRPNIDEEFFFDKGRVVGMRTTVGTNVEYAAYHEFGFHGVEQVRAYVRRVKSRNTYTREKRTSKKTGKEYNARVKTGTGIAYVRAHSRTINYAGHPFERPALADLRPAMSEAIAAAIRKALDGGAS